MKIIFSLLLSLSFYTLSAQGDNTLMASRACSSAAQEALESFQQDYQNGNIEGDVQTAAAQLFQLVCNEHCSNAVFENGQAVDCDTVYNNIANAGGPLRMRNTAYTIIQSLRRVRLDTRYAEDAMSTLLIQDLSAPAPLAPKSSTTTEIEI